MNGGTPINKWIKEVRNKKLKKINKQNKTDLISSWKDNIVFKSELYDSLTIILRTKGCRWARKSGCSMCGYIYEANKSISQKKIFKQIDQALEKNDFQKEFFVKIFTSGSFLDSQEISLKLLKKIIERLNKEKHFKGLSIESRPEFINNKKLKILKNKLSNYIIGIGLETSDDEIRKECINKGFTFKEYKDSVKKIKNQNGYVKTYLLLKPPFLSEKTSLDEMIKSSHKAAEIGSDKISINPCNIQEGTIVEKLYRNNEYRPPWIWSLMEVIKKTHQVKADIITDPTAAGKDRGVHNCGKCDEELLRSIEKYSKTQDISELIEKNCRCKEEWKTILENEEKSYNIWI